MTVSLAVTLNCWKCIAGGHITVISSVVYNINVQNNPRIDVLFDFRFNIILSSIKLLKYNFETIENEDFVN